MAEDAPELDLGPPPSWRAHLFSVFAPEGFDLAPLLEEVGGGSRPLFTIVDVAAVAGGSEEPEVIAKALADKLATDKIAGIEAKQAAIAEAAAAKAEAAAAEAAARAAAEEAGEEYVPPSEAPPETKDGEPPAELAEGEEPPLVDEPPAAEKAADVYWLLQNFPATAAQAAALAAEGLGINSMVALEMDSECLRVCKGEPEPEPTVGEDGEEIPVPPPTMLEPSAQLTELQAVVGSEGSGVENAVLMTLKDLEPEAWSTPKSIFTRLSGLLYASAQKLTMYEDFHLTLSPSIELPAPEAAPDMSHYNKLLAAAPEHALGLPYLVSCLVEQIVRTHAGEEEAAEHAETDADAEMDDIAAFLASTASLAVTAPKSSMQAAAEAAIKAADASALAPYGDRVASRLFRPSPFGLAPTAASGDAASAVERTVLGSLPYPGKERKGMPAEDAALTEEERGAERTELHHFSKFAPPQVNGRAPPRHAHLAPLVRRSPLALVSLRRPPSYPPCPLRHRARSPAHPPMRLPPPPSPSLPPLCRPGGRGHAAADARRAVQR